MSADAVGTIGPREISEERRFLRKDGYQDELIAIASDAVGLLELMMRSNAIFDPFMLVKKFMDDACSAGQEMPPKGTAREKDEDMEQNPPAKRGKVAEVHAAPFNVYLHFKSKEGKSIYSNAAAEFLGISSDKLIGLEAFQYRFQSVGYRGFEVEDHPEFIQQHCGQWPVIQMNLMKVSGHSVKDFHLVLTKALQGAASRYSYLNDPGSPLLQKLSPNEKQLFCNILNGNAHQGSTEYALWSRMEKELGAESIISTMTANTESALVDLCEILHKLFDKKPVLIVDEADSILRAQLFKNYPSDHVQAVKTAYDNVLSKVLKRSDVDPAPCYAALFTGVLGFQGDGMDQYNFKRHSSISPDYSRFFGVSKATIEKLIVGEDAKELVPYIEKSYNGMFVRTSSNELVPRCSTYSLVRYFEAAKKVEQQELSPPEKKEAKLRAVTSYWDGGSTIAIECLRKLFRHQEIVGFISELLELHLAETEPTTPALGPHKDRFTVPVSDTNFLGFVGLDECEKLFQLTTEEPIAIDGAQLLTLKKYLVSIGMLTPYKKVGFHASKAVYAVKIPNREVANILHKCVANVLEGVTRYGEVTQQLRGHYSQLFKADNCTLNPMEALANCLAELYNLKLGSIQGEVSEAAFKYWLYSALHKDTGSPFDTTPEMSVAMVANRGYIDFAHFNKIDAEGNAVAQEESNAVIAEELKVKQHKSIHNMVMQALSRVPAFQRNAKIRKIICMGVFITHANQIQVGKVVLWKDGQDRVQLTDPANTAPCQWDHANSSYIAIQDVRQQFTEMGITDDAQMPTKIPYIQVQIPDE